MTYKEYWKKHPEHREELEERAAIIEFEGEETTDEAEKLAVKVMIFKYGE